MYERLQCPARPRIADVPNTVYAGDYSERAAMRWGQKHLSAYGVLISRKDAQNKCGERVIALWKQVLVLDLPGVGNIELAKLWRPVAYRAGYGTAYKLCCDKQEGVYGIMAGYLAGLERDYGNNLLCSVEKQILSQRPLRYDNTLAYVIPGMLRYFDYDEMM